MRGQHLIDLCQKTMAAYQLPVRELVIVVDALEESCAASLRQDALTRFSHIALSAVQLQPFHVGLCTVSKLENGRDVQLKVSRHLSNRVLLRPPLVACACRAPLLTA